MIKFQPYQVCEVLAIENWLNEIAEQGYKLTEFGAFFCKFKKNDGPRVYYRARYLPGNKDIKGTFWLGDLYIYHSEDPAALPEPNYNEDAKAYATEFGRPNAMLLDLAMISVIITRLLPGMPGVDPVWSDPLLLTATIACIFLWGLRLIWQGRQWARVAQIASGAVTITDSQPNKHEKLTISLMLIPAVLVFILCFAAQMP